MAAVGKTIAEKLNKAIGHTAVIIPKRGFTTRDKEGEDFHHPEADLALVEALRKHLDPRISFVEVDAHINDKLFAERAAILLDELMRKPASRRTPSGSSSGE